MTSREEMNESQDLAALDIKAWLEDMIASGELVVIDGVLMRADGTLPDNGWQQGEHAE